MTNIGAVAKSGDTMTGALNIESRSGLRITNSLYARNDVPADSSYSYIQFQDKNKAGYSIIRSVISPIENGVLIQAISDNGSNNLGIYVAKDGTRRVTLDAPSWRSALGIGAVADDDIVPLEKGGIGIAATTTNDIVKALETRPWYYANLRSSSTVATLKNTSTSLTTYAVFITSATSNANGVYLVHITSKTSTPVITSVKAGSNLTLTSGSGNGTVTITSSVAAFASIVALTSVTYERTEFTVA